MPTVSAVGPRARREVFWLLDRVRGRPIRRHYEDVAGRMAGRAADVDALHRLLRHATSTSPFYGPYQGLDLDQFPIIDKASIKEHGARLRSRMYDGGDLHVKKTSGSTGTPMAVLQDLNKRRRTIAETIYFNERAGLQLGDRLIWLFAADLVRIPRWRRIAQNIVAVDHVGLNEARIASLVEACRREQSGAILALSSMLEVIADYVVASGIAPDELRVGTAISSGEILLPSAKRHIAAALGCPVVDRYATEENGLLACSEPGGEHLLLNRASYHFEFLRLEEDVPGSPGEISRVVVTDLYNHAMPLIRYDTGDLAVVGDVDDDGNPVTLASVSGREIDAVFDTTGGRIASVSISAVMVRAFPDIGAYRLTQVGATRYELAIVPAGARYADSEFVEVLQRWLGKDADIAVEFVEAIPRLPSGKQRPVVGRYRPTSTPGPS